MDTHEIETFLVNYIMKSIIFIILIDIILLYTLALIVLIQ